MHLVPCNLHVRSRAIRADSIDALDEVRLVNPEFIVSFTEQVLDNNPAHGHGAKQEFIELFMVPGMGHCAGGPGPNSFGQPLAATQSQDPSRNIMTALERWVEKDVEPKKIIATK